MPGHEYGLAEKPILDYLTSLGYQWLKPEENDLARDGLNNVILREEFLHAISRINGVSKEVAFSVYQELLAVQDNERWTNILRGNYSRTLPGESKKTTIRLIDFLDTRKNIFTVTNQFTVESEKTHRADVVVFVNGIPLVVIEAKSPLSAKDKLGEAFDQIKQYERDIPRLFYSNAFNIVSNGMEVLYGSTGAPSEFWGEWKDPFPRKTKEFESKFHLGLWSLLEPSRLLDLLAHFLVFEKDEKSGALIKKMCRYQQYRAVNKIVERVIENRKPRDRKGLIWHTQGSGKSLTMVYTVLKLKQHLTIPSHQLSSPNILVITDRVDLDNQISKTFEACGLPNPMQAQSANEFFRLIHSNTTGLTVLSTIFKIGKSVKAVANSREWIICCDEAHRTQEQDLGAYLRATFPEAYFFGFTGTPVSTSDHNTYETFSPRGEYYLDKYGIDEAVADGATVPIHYTARKAEWHLEAEKLDILFDNWFATEPEEKREEIKKRGVSVDVLAKHSKRVDLIAYDLWTHFKEFALPDGYKGQLVAVDREAIILYKRALDRIIAEDFIAQGLENGEAEREAAEYTVCVFSANQEDGKPSEDAYTQGIRDDLLRYQLGEEREGKWAAIKGSTTNRTETEVKKAFKKRGEPPFILIVCAKLLTGFDAPAESVMYLDNPLKEHNLLQAIARTNRVESPQKQYGLIVDYIGITRHLNEALSSYRKEDISGALHSLEELKARLKSAHREVMQYLTYPRNLLSKATNLQKEFNPLIQALGSLDAWYTFKLKARAFQKAYEALSPDPEILKYTSDLKWITTFVEYATLHFEKKESLELKHYKKKIRDMLEMHLQVTGITTLIQLKHLTDPEFFADFDTEGKSEEEIQSTVLRKATELKRTITEKLTENRAEYEPFSKRILELIQRLESGLVSAADLLKEAEALAHDLVEEENAYKKSGLDKKAHGIYKILEQFAPVPTPQGAHKQGEQSGDGGETNLNKLQKIAQQIDGLYTSDETAPIGWHLKEQLRKELRQQVRYLAVEAELDWRQVPGVVEEFALRHYVKL